MIKGMAVKEPVLHIKVTSPIGFIVRKLFLLPKVQKTRKPMQLSQSFWLNNRMWNLTTVKTLTS